MSPETPSRSLAHERTGGRDPIKGQAVAILLVIAAGVGTLVMSLTPEYVIQIQGGSILPDKKRFGIFWINERELESAFDMSGAFNSVSLKLAHGANSEEVITQLDQLLALYGSIGAYDRSQQLSHQYISDELFQLRTMATIAPAIFLSVAAFLLNIVISRMISQQREQIAALKAFAIPTMKWVFIT